MERRKKADDLTPYLSPRAAEIVRLYKAHGSAEGMLAAHPEITEDEFVGVMAELRQAQARAEEAEELMEKLGRHKALVGAAYQIKITLDRSSPPIWRRVVVPADLGLEDLHAVIQVAMGWDGSHLHLFKFGPTRFMGRDPLGRRCNTEDEDAAAFRLCEVVRKEKTKFHYLYDFGDSWKHTLLVEKIIPADKAPKSIVCLAGKNRCPVEDSGGLGGYYHRLDILADPSHPRHAEVLEWMGVIDPTEFNLDKVNAKLAKFTA